MRILKLVPRIFMANGRTLRKAYGRLSRSGKSPGYEVVAHLLIGIKFCGDLDFADFGKIRAKPRNFIAAIYFGPVHVGNLRDPADEVVQFGTVHRTVVCNSTHL